VNAVFLNDTSTGHAGSVAASQSILGVLRRAGVQVVYRHPVGSCSLPKWLEGWSQSRIEKHLHCDPRSLLVVCHGEGTLHKAYQGPAAPRASWLLSQLRGAAEAGLRVAVLNALLGARSGEALCDMATNRRAPTLVTVREPMSLKTLGQAPDCVLLADSCADPRVWEGGEPLFELPPIVRGFTHPSSQRSNVLDKHDYVRFGLFQRFRDVVATLRTCSCYLTGQHHGVYAAGLAGIPFVPVPSNSHKIEALIQWSGLPIRIARDHKQVKDHMKWARAHPKVFQDFHRWLVSRPYLTEEHLRPLLDA